MTPSIFLSYSRLCVGFVDDLFNRLEKQGFQIWLDYRSLIPGRPWVEQIERGLAGAELLLLVVSPESIASKSVELEWRYFLDHGKRIILLIFQATSLPPELASREWVDFRGAHGSAIRRLIRRIETPARQERSAPQSGFKAPPMVWLTAAVSAIASIYSLFAIWTFLIPWTLVPLPVLVFKRNFNLARIQTALWTLPVALFFSLGLASELGLVNMDADFDTNASLLYNLGLLFLFLQVFLVPLLSIFLLLLLRLPAMQRWGRPEASLARFANVYHPNVPRPEPVQFYIDHAPQDRVIAHEIAEELKKYGHSPAGGIDSAEEVLVLVSRFKTDTEADPEKQVVYPIIVQRAKVSEKLSRVQWIDFRKGIRNLKAMAQLLPQPARMLSALGVRPTSGNEGAMPTIILALVDFLIIMAMVILGSFISYLLELQHVNLGLILQRETEKVLGLLLLEILLLVSIGRLIHSMIRALTERHGWLAFPWKFLLGLGGLLALVTLQGMWGDALEALFSQHDIITSEAMFAGLPLVIFLAGMLLVGIAALFRRKDLRRWFPAVEIHQSH